MVTSPFIFFDILLTAMRELYLERMDIVNRTAYEANPDLASYIFKGVTEGLSFNQLNDRYRWFFWLFDRMRN